MTALIQNDRPTIEMLSNALAFPDLSDLHVTHIPHTYRGVVKNTGDKDLYVLIGNFEPECCYAIIKPGEWIALGMSVEQAEFLVGET